ncbi:MAG: ATP-binding protein [Candidatus Marsarchaeota archaeon]|nr:ATP-binding protein [Candidatus Marsarchaeota archaeon]
MTLFDTKPKSDPRFLYGREKELDGLVESLKKKNWVIILGPRRVGKTSLAECAIKRMGRKIFLLDARENNNFIESLNKLLATPESSLKVKAEIRVPYTPINIGAEYNKTLSKKDLDSLLKKVGHIYIIIDEAQWLVNPRKVVMLLAHLYDYYYDSVTFIITGSMIGVLKSIVEPGPSSPLYGRAITEMEIKRWQSSISLSFLKTGTAELGLRLNEKMAIEVEENLDGLPGWLTLFGYNYAQVKNPNIALTKTIKEAKKIVSQELKSIAELGIGTPKLIEVLRVLAKEPVRFVDIAKATNFNNTSLSKYLSTLNRLEYIEKDSKSRYFISDPMLLKFIEEKARD